MNHLSLSDKGQRLVDMYSQMAKHGYATNIGVDIKAHTIALNYVKYVMLLKINLHNMTLALFLIMVVVVQIGPLPAL